MNIKAVSVMVVHADKTETPMPPSEARRWLQWLKDHEPVFETNLRRMQDKDPEHMAAINRYFRMKYLRLRVFLRIAIRLNEPIIWSV